MEVLIIVIVLVVFIAIFGVLFYVAYSQIKKTDPKNVDTSVGSGVSRTQDFIPIEDIKDSTFHLGRHQYRAVIKCSSLNYNLKTDKEQDVIELSFQRFLNSLNHPISIFIQTKVMDNTKMLESLKDDIEEAVAHFPILANYGSYYFNKMANIYDNIGNNKEKKKYIIIPYDGAIELTNSSDEEKYEYALNELQNRCLIVMDNLQSLGIHTEVLKTPDLIDLIYSVYHKEEANQAENINNGDFLSLFVDGDDKLMDLSPEARLDWILYEAQKRLEVELSSDKAASNEIKAKANLSIQKINELRDDIAGYFKEEHYVDMPNYY